MGQYTIPTVVERTPLGERAYDIYSSLLSERITAAHTGQSVETVSRDGDRDRWFSAEEAKEYGMVDRVVESLDDVRPAVSQRRMGH